MRYLWVEDFNDESSVDTENELKERLIDFFDLRNDKVIIKKNLTSAIDFLEDKDNLYEIDAVLIDIRFPEGEDSELYPKYFNDIVTSRFYANNIEEASGILLYLLLVFRYHISQQKIAFVSANISSDNGKLKTIQDMVEIIVKSKFVDLSEDDKISYRTSERKLGHEILKIKSQEKEWDTFISKDRQVESIDLDKLLKQIRQLPLNHPDKFLIEHSLTEVGESNAQVKYNAVKNQFDKIGFVMPSAFEKPKIGEKKEKRYSFIQWEYELYLNSYNAVRSSVQEMCMIVIDYLYTCKCKPKIYSDFLELLSCEKKEKNNYDENFFIRYLKDIMGTFPLDCAENSEKHCERVVKEITALWEASLLPKYRFDNNDAKRSGEIKTENRRSEIKTENRRSEIETENRRSWFEHNDKGFYASHATMKIVRNWAGHQGIKNLNIIDVGLIFLLNMRGIFDIDRIPEQYIHRYEECEEKLLSMFELTTQISDDISGSLNYFYALNNATKEGNNSSHEIYDKISGLGHSKSTIRREVSMDDIYMLLYHILNQGCSGTYIDVRKAIRVRTWKNWKARYNARFGKIIKCS